MTVQEMDGRFCHPPSVFTLPPTQRSWYLAAIHTEKPSHPAAQRAILQQDICCRQRHLPTKILGQQLEQKDMEA